MSDEPEPDRIRSSFEDDRNCCGRRLRRNCHLSCSRGNHCDLTTNQISQYRRQPINSALRPVVLYNDVAAIDIPGFAQSCAKRRRHWRVALGGSGVDKPDYRQGLLLRARRQRPSRRRAAAEECDEFPPPHGAYPKARITNEL